MNFGNDKFSVLSNFFGFKEFREGQEEIIDSITNNLNVLAVLPTGGGKSLCYQIPAILSETFAIVISPLIALMSDQVNSLNKIQTVAESINSTKNYFEIEDILRSIQTKQLKLLYTSPEKLSNKEFLSKLMNLNPEYLFVDEAHCISEWGHSFRPEYRNLNQIAEEYPEIKISAFTATATPIVRKDIIENLKFKIPKTIVKGFQRDNIKLNVNFGYKKLEIISQILSEKKGSSIIYCATRKQTEEVSNFLLSKGFNSAYFHAGLNTNIRAKLQKDFLEDKIRIIVATSAFGMGIDKKDVRIVIHYNVTSSIEAYYQEFGRAGRDGKTSEAFLLVSNRDFEIQKFLIEQNYINYNELNLLYDLIFNHFRIALGSISENFLHFDLSFIKKADYLKLNLNKVNEGMNLLEMKKLIIQKKDLKKKYFIHFLKDIEYVKKFTKEKNHPPLTHLIYSVLKYYGSKPFLELTEIELQQLTEDNVLSIGHLLKILERLNELKIISFTKLDETMSIKMVEPRMKLSELPFTEQELKTKVNLAIKRLYNIKEYVKTNRCRFSYILEYFGEKKENYKCGNCDNCLKGENSTKIFDYTESNIIIYLKKYSPIKTNILFEKLRMEKGIFIFNYDIYIKTLNKLKFNGEVSQIGDDIYLNIDKNDSSQENTDNKINSKLLNQILILRKKASVKYNQNKTLILPDEIINRILENEPKTKNDLLNVNGFTENMFFKIGNELLEILNSYLTTDNKINSELKNLIKLLNNKTPYSKLLSLSENETNLSLQIEFLIKNKSQIQLDYLFTQEEKEELNKNFSIFKNDFNQFRNSVKEKISYGKIRIFHTIKLFS